MRPTTLRSTLLVGIVVSVALIGASAEATGVQDPVQFGSDIETMAIDVYEDDTYVVGRTDVAFPGYTSAGRGDAFIRKADATGAEVWAHQFGSPVWDYFSDVV